ncbi:terminase [Kitasatospora sp. NPDC006786]|uniref:terminase n=1 Tax=unclassified Kitasatospora TaxID=2633591 RepID=UPI0033F22471
MTTSETWAPPSELAEQCMELYALRCPPYWGPPRRLDWPTLGGKAARAMEAIGHPPMPWQRYTLDVGLEINPHTGRFAYREVGLSVPRQQGKTDQILTVMLHRIMAWPRQNVVYAAQTRGMARTRWEDEFLTAMEAAPKLRGKFTSRKANGNEAIIWTKTRSKLGITANTEKAGHGPPLDLGVIDEAFAHEDDRLEQAFSPAMLTRPMAQLWWASAGGTERSVFLNKKRQAGRELVERAWASGEWPSVCYFEWFAPDHLDRADPATWYSCMPALGHTVTEDVVRSELEKLDPAEFDRAYLNRTRKHTPPEDPNVPKTQWTAAADETSRPVPDVALAVDVSPLRDWASIAAASRRPDGRIHLEVVDRRAGTDWVADALGRLAALWRPVVVTLDAKGPVGSLVDALADEGIRVSEDPEHPERGDLLIPRTGDVVAACGQLADAIRQGTVVHTDQTPLTAAVNGARTRPLGDAWAWHRRNAQTDISPLVAVTLARWALLARLPALADPYDPVANVW